MIHDQKYRVLDVERRVFLEIDAPVQRKAWTLHQERSISAERDVPVDRAGIPMT